MALVYNTKNCRLWLGDLQAGQSILLSGRVYTARDAAHKKIVSLLQQGKELPFELKDAFIYYAGPTPAPTNRVCGSFGPTTSARMDSFAPLLYGKGLAAGIGKGDRSDEVIKSIRQSKGAYLCAIGGAGAYYADRITSLREIAFPELGCESVKELEFFEFPLIVAIDSQGNDIYRM